MVINDWLMAGHKQWYVKADSSFWFIQTTKRDLTQLGQEDKVLRSFEVQTDRLRFLGGSPDIPKTMSAADPDFFAKLSYVLDLIEAMND